MKSSILGLLALVLMPSLAYADQENVYDFVFTGVLTDVPFGAPVPPHPTSELFTVTFLANSPTLPFPGKNDPFSATLNAYDVDIVIGNQVVLQDGTGGFAFAGSAQGPYGPGGTNYFGSDWSFRSSALTWFGAPFFALFSPDPLNASYASDISAGCTVPGNNTFEGVVTCAMSGHSGLSITPVAAPEPGTLALFALGLTGLALMRRRKSQA